MAARQIHFKRREDKAENMACSTHMLYLFITAEVWVPKLDKVIS
jgi:hypothetical protein